ncbi:MAG: NACHT domain-containing protein [Verrucomicrobia bacterium]|nr:NACHT domain-containing protein [Verrucomicrobiota bacterium]
MEKQSGVIGKFEEEAAKNLFQLVWGSSKSFFGLITSEKHVRDAIKNYVSRYHERYGRVKVLGMNEPVPLAQIYTEVRMLPPSVLHRYADAELMKQDFISNRKHTTSGESLKSIDGIKIANDIRLLTILGSPGSGKSTFLRRLGQCCLLSTGHFNLQRLPVVLSLSEHKEIKCSEDVIAGIAKEFSNCGFIKSDKMAESLLKKGVLMILFDGLDEVPKANLVDVVTSVKNFVDQYGYRPDFKSSQTNIIIKVLTWFRVLQKSELLEADNREANRFVITCRTAHYKQWFDRFTDVIIADFSDQQIDQFAKNWFREQTNKDTLNSKRFLTELHSLPSALELARTPLLLTFLCIVWEQGQTLPRVRATLYKEALEVLLRKWAASKLVHNDPVYSELHYELELDLLAQIARNFTFANQVFFGRDNLLKEIKNFLEQEMNAPKNLDAGGVLDAIAIQQGLLTERAIDIWSFSHLTIQEFLTARHLRASNEWITAVNNFLFDTRWRETFLLMAGIGRADNLLEAMAERVRKFTHSDKHLLKFINWIDQSVSNSIQNQTTETQALAYRCLFTAFIISLDRAVLEEDRRLPVDLAIAIDQSIIVLDNTFIPAHNRPTDLASLLVINFPILEGTALEISKINNPILTTHEWESELNIPTGIDRVRKNLWEIVRAIQLIIDTKNTSYSLSPAKWNLVCSRLLTSL